MKNLFIIALFLVASNSFAQDTITTAKVAQYVGKDIWVKGIVASVKMATDENNVNYINVDKAFPQNIFTVVISTKYLQRLKLNLATAKGKQIWVKGTVITNEKDRGQVPQIFNPSQIRIK